ncbi:MAG TPA: lysylphosphatidylglycerol synthase transmembrane domain-containing protein, partial [Streptosporangiaceae bacterium]
MTTPARTPQPHRPEAGQAGPPGSAAERPSGAGGSGGSPPGKQSGASPTRASIVVEDQVVRRIRRPADLLRCLVDIFWIGVLVAAGLAARATTQGVETDVVDASRRLQDVVLPTLRGISLFGLLAFLVALAVRQLIRRQGRRLAEAVATGAATFGLVLLANLVLRSDFAGTLYRAIAMAPPGPSSFAPIDATLAGLVAFTTIIDLSGRTRWRVALWLTVGVYLVTSLADLRTSVLSVLISLLVGRVIALAVRYAAGSPSQRPSAEAIGAALGSADEPVIEMRRVAVSGVESRRYAAATPDGGRLDVTVFDRDQQAAGLLYRLYRLVRLRDQVARRAPLSTERLAERRALLSYAVEDAGVRTPRLRAVLRVGPDAMALATDADGGTSLARRGSALTDREVEHVWDAVLRLHAHRVTHRALTADKIVICADGQIKLLDPGGGDIAASDLQLRLDLAQLLAELATLTGPDRAADLAQRKLDGPELIGLLPLLQPVVLAQSTRMFLRRHKHLLAELRARVLAIDPGDGQAVPPVQLERVRPRTVITLVATILAVYLLTSELARVNLGTLLRTADPLWILVAFGLSALTYAGAAWQLSGFVLERLSFTRTVLAQLASSFVTLVTPAAVGGAALNVRYLQRRKIPPAVAVASVGASQVVAFVLHAVLLVIFVAITGARSNSLRPPTWAYWVLAGLVLVALIVLAVPRGRRLLRARLGPALSQVGPRLVAMVQRP